MTLYLDASALVALHVDTPARDTVREALQGDPDWCTSSLTLVESLALGTSSRARSSTSLFGSFSRR